MPTEQLKIPVSRAASAKCAAQHFGAWSIEPKWFASAISAIRGGTLKPMQGAWDDDDDDDDDQQPDYTLNNGVAVISIDGQMTKSRFVVRRMLHHADTGRTA